MEENVLKSRASVSRRKLIAFCLVAGVGLGVAGCTSQAPADNQGKGGAVSYKITTTTPPPVGDIDSVTWRTHAEAQTLDYAQAFAGPENLVIANICESLVRFNPDFTSGPALAKSWDNPSPTTWVFHLQEGVTFHDGTPMTADDVVASLTRNMDPSVASVWASVFAYVKSITATGPLEVTVELTKPDALFVPNLGSQAGVVESAATLKKLGKTYGTPDGLPNCTGPFSAEKWNPGKSIVLKGYDKYWNNEWRAHSKTFTIVPIIDDSTALNALKSGDVDGSWFLPATAYKQLKTSAPGNAYFIRDL
ncbi:MAG: ABC transporter substrate-binding protein, partial [Pseudolysinimonas sp.]